MAVFSRVVAAAVILAASFGMALSATGADLQWAPYGSLPGNSPAFSLAGDPGAPGSVYAATLGDGLLRTDDGKNWSQIGAGSLPRRLWRVTIDPAKGPGGGPPPIYVGSGGQGFYKSLDGGKSWHQMNSGLSNSQAQNVRSITLGRQLIVIGTSDGVYKSGDGGKGWQAIGLQGLDVSAVAFAQHANPAVVLAGIDGTRDAGSRLVRSVDMGANWIPLKQGVPADIVVTAIAAGAVPSGANLRPLFVAGSPGVLKSDDGGQSWSQLSGLPPQGFNGLIPSPYDANILYAVSDGGGGANGGVWRSADRGSTWTAIGGGLGAKGITGMALGRNAPATLVAAAWNPDKPASPVFSVSDNQVVPQGQPEGGVCPEPGTQEQCTALNASGAAGPIPAFSPQSACPSPLPSPSPSASPSGAGSPSASPQASATSPSASPRPSLPPGCSPPTPSTQSPSKAGSDLPLGVAIVVLAVLALLLGGRLFLTRR